MANLTISSVIDENKVTSICEDLFDYYYDENDEEYKKEKFARFLLEFKYILTHKKSRPKGRLFPKKLV